MTKKIPTYVLAAALAATLVSLPAAASDSVAGIEFSAGTVEPGDPGNPDEQVDGVVNNLNFYFGSQEISSATQNYASVNNADAPYNGLGEKVGYIVANNAGSTTAGWTVTVEIGSFSNDGGSTTTLNGFTLTMTPETGYPKAAAGTTANGNTAPSANTVALTAGAANAKVLFSAGAGEARGAWGSNWTGSLNVLGGTATAGQAQATMIWTLAAV